jgi:hypothetical protein
MRLWAISTLLLCACAPTTRPTAPLDPTEVELEAPRPAPIADARPLDPELAALLTPESLAAANPQPPAPDPRTPAERARDLCERYCEREFDRDRLIRRLLHPSPSSESMHCHHGCPPDELEDEDGWRRFMDGERSTLWWRSNFLIINPYFERVEMQFFGTLIEIDEHNRVLRCRHVDYDDPTESVDMACSARE